MTATVRTFLTAVLASIVLLGSGSVRAGTVVDLDLPAIVAAADRFAEGTVASVQTIEDGDGTPWTRVVIEVRRELGEPPADADASWTLDFLGGTPEDGPELVVDDLPRPEPGDRVLVASDRAEGRIAPVVGVWQGWFELEADGWTDAAGRVLSVGPDGVVRGTEAGDVDAVLDALERGDFGPVAPEPGDAAERDEPVDDEPTEDRPADGDALPDAPPQQEADAPDRSDAPEPVAVRLRVEDADAASAMRTAAAAWREAGAPLRLEIEEAADDRVTVGASDAFGPHALSFTMRSGDRPGVELRLRPGTEGRRTDLGMRELAWLAGVPGSATGLRSGRLPADEELRPSDADVAAWNEARGVGDADLTGDGRTSFYDLVRLAEAFGRSGTRLPEDLDRSGRVDEGDLERLRERYEFDAPSRTPPPGYVPADGR